MNPCRLKTVVIAAALASQTTLLDALPAEFKPGPAFSLEGGRECHHSAHSDLYRVCLRWEFFEIRAWDYAQLENALNTYAPGEYWARTETTTRWREGDDDQCEVQLDTLIIFPKLVPSRTHTDEFKANYERFSVSIKKHELNHHGFALQETWFEFITNCATADTLSDRIQFRHDEYDRQTDGGVTETYIFE